MPAKAGVVRRWAAVAPGTALMRRRVAMAGLAVVGLVVAALGGLPPRSEPADARPELHGY